MEKISELLQEAKPLYFERKRRHTQIKAIVFSLSIVLVSFFSVMHLNIGDTVAINDKTGEVSIIEEYGLPVDDYGLFKFD